MASINVRFDEPCNLLLLYGKHSFWRTVQSDWSIWGPDFAVMPSAAVAGHYEIFNAPQNKTKQNRTKQWKH